MLAQNHRFVNAYEKEFVSSGVKTKNAYSINCNYMADPQKADEQAQKTAAEGHEKTAEAQREAAREHERAADDAQK